MQCCIVTHFPSFPPIHSKIVALHCSINSPIEQFFVLHKYTVICFEFEDGVWTRMLRYVKVYTADMHVSKLEINVSLISLIKRTAKRKYFLQVGGVLREEVDTTNC